MGQDTAEVLVRVRRSTRRRRTVAARLEAGELIVMIPDTFTAHQERDWVQRMRTRVLARAACAVGDEDQALLERARRLSGRHLGGAASPTSVRWVDNMAMRWGSATPAHGSIRLSRTLLPMPEYVVDYVLLHELAHLIEPNHGSAFWGLLAGFPRLERARGYLEGYAAAHGRFAGCSPVAGGCGQSVDGGDAVDPGPD